jgi:hypothetical protein
MVQVLGANILKTRLGNKYEPQCAPPSAIHYLNASVGSFEAALGDDPHTAEWMWADEEEIHHRKRLKIEPPPVVHDHEGMLAAQKFMRNAQGMATVPEKQQRPSLSANTAADASDCVEDQRIEQPQKCESSENDQQMMGLGEGWETVEPDEQSVAKDDNAVALGDGPQAGPHGKFPGLKLTGSSPPDTLFEETASPQPVSWLQPRMNHSQQYGQHVQHIKPKHTSLLPPCAPQYGRAPSYEAIDVCQDLGNTYQVYQQDGYYGMPDYYQPPLPSEPYEEEKAPPLPDEPPPPLPDEPPPLPMAHWHEELPPPPPRNRAAQEVPQSPPPPLPDEPPPPLPDEPYAGHIQVHLLYDVHSQCDCFFPFLYLVPSLSSQARTCVFAVKQCSCSTQLTGARGAASPSAYSWYPPSSIRH